MNLNSRFVGMVQLREESEGVKKLASRKLPDIIKFRRRRVGLSYSNVRCAQFSRDLFFKLFLERNWCGTNYKRKMGPSASRLD